MAYRQWQDLTTTDFGALDKGTAVAVVPIAATEQHGPHLPVGTDAMIAAGMLQALEARAGDGPDILVLPTIAVGASLEHERFAGTLSVPSAGLADQIGAVGQGVSAAGLSKLVIVSSHGGNVAAMTDASLRCRAEMEMLAVNLTWARLGLPDNLAGDDERAFGVHGGFVETSLMLHFRPDLVKMDAAENFQSLQQRLAAEHDLLRAYGPVGFGWLAGDLNREGVVGNASSASAEAGLAIASYQAERFSRLLGEVGQTDLAALFR
ncbi:MAG TPA: creatininase family protein [Afifellaceae bacterium]|nr:creatininase family protein [Afifellaceae bacterium]